MQNAKTKKSNRGRFLAVACGIVAVVALAAVIILNQASPNKKVELTGTWKIKSLAQKDKKYDQSDLGKVKFDDGSITFNENGTGAFSETGQNATVFEYDKEKSTMKIGDKTIELHIEGKTLTFKYNDVDYTFEK